MEEKTARKSRRRRWSRDRVELAKALTERQDAQARRMTRRIAELNREHHPIDIVEETWSLERARIRRIVESAYNDPALAQKLSEAGDVSTVELLLRERARRVLGELADCSDLPPARPRAMVRRLRPSRSLALARARSAVLQARYLEIKEQILVSLERVK